MPVNLRTFVGVPPPRLYPEPRRWSRRRGGRGQIEENVFPSISVCAKWIASTTSRFADVRLVFELTRSGVSAYPYHVMEYNKPY